MSLTPEEQIQLRKLICKAAGRERLPHYSQTQIIWYGDDAPKVLVWEKARREESACIIAQDVVCN